MQVRKWNVKKDYPSILKWCQQRNWDSPIPKETLPVMGVMVTDEKDFFNNWKTYENKIDQDNINILNAS